jgi:3-methyl-2-oxobutanoate hydroxymethyltransferase
LSDRVTVPALQAMKREGRKIVGVVAWDTPTARVVDAAGVDVVSVGDSVAVSLWGREQEGDVTLDEMLLVCSAVSRGVQRALVSCDLPKPSVEAARRLVGEGGADMVKVEGDDEVAAIAAAGIAVFAQMSGDDPVAEARRLEEAGASLLDFRHSGPEQGAKVVQAVAIPVIGGLGGGPWLDGRVRAIHRLLDDAVAAYADDVRAGRPVKGD